MPNFHFAQSSIDVMVGGSNIYAYSDDVNNVLYTNPSAVFIQWKSKKLLQVATYR